MNTTTDNVIPRRRASDWTGADVIAADTRLQGLIGLVRLAAFAGEARRVLSSVDYSLERRPDLCERLKNEGYSSYWHDMPDASGQALDFLADELDRARGDLVELTSRQQQRAA